MVLISHSFVDLSPKRTDDFIFVSLGYFATTSYRCYLSFSLWNVMDMKKEYARYKYKEEECYISYKNIL